MKKYILSIPLLISLISCSNINTGSSGSLDINIKFPYQTSFNTKAISNKTEYVTLNISGDGLNNEILKKISKNEANKSGQYNYKFYGLPFGNKKIIAQALDINNKVVSVASSDVNILEGGNKAVFEFKNILQRINFKINNYSKEGSQNLLEMEIEGGTKTFKEFSGNNLVMEDLPNGPLKFNITVTDSFNRPIQHGTTTFNINDNQSEYTFDLKDVSFPQKSQLNINESNFQAGRNFLADFEESFIPQPVTEVFEQNIIRFPDNLKPVFQELDVNGEFRDKQNLQSSVIVKKGSKLEISTKAEDPENDKFSYTWGLVSKVNNNTGEMEILSEKTNKVNLDYITANTGVYYLIAMVFDNKSEYSYITIPIVVFENNINLDIIGEK